MWFRVKLKTKILKIKIPMCKLVAPIKTWMQRDVYFCVFDRFLYVCCFFHSKIYTNYKREILHILFHKQ